MCGIFAFLSQCHGELDLELLQRCLMQIQYRGPDNTKEVTLKHEGKGIYLGFHRLAINGLGHESDEPLVVYRRQNDPGSAVWLICNGEIYNFKKLIERFHLPVTTHNDCEVILHLYLKYGFTMMLNMLDGVFSMVLIDSQEKVIYVANDPIGIRPLFWGFTSRPFEDRKDYPRTKYQSIAWASEPIALKDCCQTVSFFPPGCYQRVKLNPEPGEDESQIKRYYFYSYLTLECPIEKMYLRYHDLLIQAVEKRLSGERPVACLLSGGLDSSLVSAIAARAMARYGKKISTFSIGLEGSPDLKFARMVADYIGSDHHEVVVDQDSFLSVIPEVVQAIQSYDVTTIRASCGNYLIAKFIAENTDFKIILNGDVSEEINGSYYYSKFCPSEHEFLQDNLRLLREVHRYDVLRSARCIEHFGLEARTPFADKKLVNFVMSVPPKYKMFGEKCSFQMEKMLLREAFKGDYLPEQVLWRPKTAFSDGVSKKEKSWHKIIEEHVAVIVTDDELRDCPWSDPKPFSKEAYYYRRLFHNYMGDRHDMVKLIEEYWMPRFVKGINDPSARELGNADDR